MQGQDESQQSAELRQAFLRHLPKRLDSVRRRGRRLVQSGWDINALTLLFDEVQAVAGACGRYGMLDLGERLFALENLLLPCIEQINVPDDALTLRIGEVLEALGPSPQSAPATSERRSQDGDGYATADGIPLQVVPPAEFIARFATPPLAAPDEPAPAAAEVHAEVIEAPTDAIESRAGAVEAAAAVAEAPAPIPVPLSLTEGAPAAIVAEIVPSGAAGAASNEPAPRPGRVTVGAGRRVYHLSDGAGLAAELDQRLEAQDFELHILDSVEELREILRSLSPNLVIVDAAFLDAIEEIGQALRPVRNRSTSRVALMVLSEQGDVAVRLKAMRAGADSFIALPASAGDVLARIAELLDAETAEPFRVMIIEDDRAQALFAESILRKSGMETVAVMDPLSALDALESFDPELILMDLYMPNCDGMELTTLIRERERFINTPIVFLSGEHDTDKRFDALSAGGDDYLEKPIRPKYLISAVTNRVRRARLLNRRVQAQNPRDPVTGLFDRAHVIDRVSEVLAGDENATNLGGVLFVIIDGAQSIRERIGLSAFDTLLHQAGAMLAGLVAGVDLAARYGDTSFVVLVPGRGEHALLAFGDEIRVRFEKHVFEIGDKSLTLAVSIGIATFAQGWHDAGSMLNAAERACALARSDPERKVRLYEAPSAPAAVGETDALLNEIRDALKFDKFQLLFQPIASLQGTGEEQFQVLLRLRGEGGRLYTAAEVVPLAEKAGTINAVDRWVLSRCLMVLAERERIDRPVRLFVSQSIEAMLDPQRLPWLQQQIEARRVDAERLVLEFRFTDVLARLRQATTFVEAAGPLGVKVALSNFEASMASYQMLQHLPVHYLKVAGKYTAADGRARGELRQIVTYAHERKIRLVAPLVEDAQTAAALWATGIDFIQGDFVQQATQDLEFDFRASAN